MTDDDLFAPHRCTPTRLLLAPAAAIAVWLALPHAPTHHTPTAPELPAPPATLSPDLVRRAQVERTADRLATTFARYLSGTTGPGALRTVPTADPVVAAMERTPRRSTQGAHRQKAAYRAGAVSVQASGSAWVVSTTLSPTVSTTSGFPLTARVALVRGRPTIVSISGQGDAE